MDPQAALQDEGICDVTKEYVGPHMSQQAVQSTLVVYDSLISNLISSQVDEVVVIELRDPVLF